ncbi:BT_3987 domain-containing protein [Bacteroides sp.]|uniref:BT_3987 domain-containing protein n=1 Tax=Bacteroides sp. TaxID=29523 RepID=UPI00402A3EC4
MKNNPFKYFVFLMLSLLMVATTGCTEDDISMPAGQLPDETPMNSVGGQLCSGKTFSRMITIDLYEDEEEGVEEISYALTKSATNAVTLKVVADEALVDAYNEEYKTELEVLPIDNINLENDGTLTIAAGKQISAPIKVLISTEGLEVGKPYLLALTVANMEMQTDKQKLYYRVYIQEKVTTIEPNAGMPQEIPELLPNLTSVFYVNTETYQPLIAGAWGAMIGRELYSLGNIVNLKTATIDYDASSQRAMFKLGVDLSYVLEHSDKYLRPIQAHNRKICLCIENGGKGVGFCNMTDMQIIDFVRQIKAVITHYNLDGVNLWDDDSKYGKAGMPEMNTTSYPKLIKALREVLSGKLLTLVDKGNATEYFYDVAKCGGIEVGNYLDYAWHGYFSSSEELQIINPKLEGGVQIYSKYTRRPIAGLNETCYGNVIVPCYSDNNREIRDFAAKTIAQWKSAGNKKSDILVYGDNLIGQEYGGYENAVKTMIGSYSILQFMDDGDGWDFVKNKFIYGAVYYKSAPLNYTLNAGPDMSLYRKDW